MAQEEIIFRDIPKNQSEIIRVSLSEFNGHQGINIRTFYLDKKTETYLPTKKGIWIPIKIAPDVSATFVDALKQLAEGDDK